jgi:hypothetical protein
VLGTIGGELGVEEATDEEDRTVGAVRGMKPPASDRLRGHRAMGRTFWNGLINSRADGAVDAPGD